MAEDFNCKKWLDFDATNGIISFSKRVKIFKSLFCSPAPDIFHLKVKSRLVVSTAYSRISRYHTQQYGRVKCNFENCEVLLVLFIHSLVCYHRQCLTRCTEARRCVRSVCGGNWKHTKSPKWYFHIRHDDEYMEQWKNDFHFHFSDSRLCRQWHRCRIELHKSSQRILKFKMEMRKCSKNCQKNDEIYQDTNKWKF